MYTGVCVTEPVTLWDVVWSYVHWCVCVTEPVTLWDDNRWGSATCRVRCLCNRLAGRAGAGQLSTHFWCSARSLDIMWCAAASWSLWLPTHHTRWYPSAQGIHSWHMLDVTSISLFAHGSLLSSSSSGGMFLTEHCHLQGWYRLKIVSGTIISRRHYQGLRPKPACDNYCTLPRSHTCKYSNWWQWRSYNPVCCL